MSATKAAIFATVSASVAATCQNPDPVPPLGETELRATASVACEQVIEGEIATPMLLARRFTINPVAVILALLFWYWMWGVPGAVLAVPMLAITKIVCDDIRPLRAFGHFLEG